MAMHGALVPARWPGLLESAQQRRDARLFFSPMSSADAQAFVILGRTRDGRAFRPTDWAERLAGVMSQFRPGGAQRGSHLGYSPWCKPSVHDGIKCVLVHPDLRGSDVLAWDFCVNFARDNDLVVVPVAGAPAEKSA